VGVKQKQRFGVELSERQPTWASPYIFCIVKKVLKLFSKKKKVLKLVYIAMDHGPFKRKEEH